MPIIGRGGVVVHEISAPGMGSGGATPADDWTRPADWIALPTLVDGDEKVVGIYAVYNHDSNFVAFRCSGAYTVDWGDGGAPEDVASNTTAEHCYDSDDYTALGAGTDCSRGYRQALITITPQAGQNLTAVSFDYKHSQAGLNAYRSQWLDIAVAGGNITSLLVSGMNGYLAMLEQFTFVGTVSVGLISMAVMFYGCYSLQSVPLFDTSGVSNMASMFSGCDSLQSVPLFDTSGVDRMYQMFYNCHSLGAAPLQGTVIDHSFASCKLSRDELVAVFNGLGTVTGKTITITGNWGVPYLSAPDRAIATGKGWTIAE